MWTILNRPVFIDWFKTLNSRDKVNVRASLILLEERGPTLPSPYADTLEGSKVSNLKELRVQRVENQFGLSSLLTLSASVSSYVVAIRLVTNVSG